MPGADDPVLAYCTICKRMPRDAKSAAAVTSHDASYCAHFGGSAPSVG